MNMATSELGRCLPTGDTADTYERCQLLPITMQFNNSTRKRVLESEFVGVDLFEVAVVLTLMKSRYKVGCSEVYA